MRTLLTAASLIMLSACVGSLPITDTGLNHPSGWGDNIRATAQRSWIYAQLSTNAYRPDVDHYKLPPSVRVLEVTDDDEIGFAYSVFQLGDGKTVISYRGTSDRRDWWAGNVLGKQNPRGLAVFDRWREKLGPDVPIAVTGHSLGGAIATHVSLRRPNAPSFIFNSSPRFSRGKERIHNDRESIVEYGEVLKITRLFGQEADQLYTSIGCSRGTPIKQHKMRKLGDCLTEAAAYGDPEALNSARLNGLDLPKATQ